jgi:hypothetical protein
MSEKAQAVILIDDVLEMGEDILPGEKITVAIRRGTVRREEVGELHVVGQFA